MRCGRFAGSAPVRIGEAEAAPRRRPKAFLDANVLVSASISPAGLAIAVLRAAVAGRAHCSTSQAVVAEAERALRDIDESAVRIFRRMLSRARVRVHGDPSSEQVRDVAALAHVKDLHVVAAAIRARVQYLVTFNLRDFRGRALRERYGITVVHPRTFVRLFSDVGGRTS